MEAALLEGRDAAARLPSRAELEFELELERRVEALRTNTDFCRTRVCGAGESMNKSIFSISLAGPLLWAACGGSFPPPTQRMAEAESAQRSAREVGAADEPSAALSLKLADEQIVVQPAAAQ